MTNDKTREDFEAWVTKQGHAAGYGGDGVYDVWVVSRWWESWQAATQQSAARIAALEAERADFRDASKVNFENYEFQRRKADAATASVYQFHYAMKDAGWHPGRTDDNLCDIIRAKGAELAKLEAEVMALRKDAERYRWLKDNRSYSYAMQPDSPAEHGIEYQWQQGSYEERNQGIDGSIDAAIDAAIEAERGEG